MLPCQPLIDKDPLLYIDVTDNEPSLALQRSLGMTISANTFHWLWKDELSGKE